MTPFFALLSREIHRFLKLWVDTVISPLASTILFLAVFSIIMADRTVDGLPYATFIYTGLLAMNVLTGSFANPAFALVISRNVGTLVDLQITPLPAWQIGLAYAMAGATRAIVILVLVLAVTAWFIPELGVTHLPMLIGAIVLSGIQFGILGTIFGMWAKGFESLPFVTSFIIQPMVFLGGVFYPITQLPGIWAEISLWNPLHHNINLVRYAFTGYSDAAISTSWLVLLVSLIPLGLIMHFSLKKNLKQ